MQVFVFGFLFFPQLQSISDPLRVLLVAATEDEPPWDSGALTQPAVWQAPPAGRCAQHPDLGSEVKVKAAGPGRPHCETVVADTPRESSLGRSRFQKRC